MFFTFHWPVQINSNPKWVYLHVTLSPFSKHTTMTSCIYLVFIIPRLLNFTLKYSRDKSHTRHLLFGCHSTVCTCARHIILSIPHQSSLVNMAANHVHHLDKNLNDCHEHDIDWNLLPQSIREVSQKSAFRQIFFFFTVIHCLLISCFLLLGM